MRKELDGGLILRSLSEGHESDRARLPEFYAFTFGEAGDSDARDIFVWTQDLASGKHPATTLDDIWVVVDPAKDDEIVSALLLIPQTWRYDGIEFGAGRVELVATNRFYRRRGLVRQQIQAAHERSAALGHLVTGITGITHYYRRFGYAMAMDLGIRAAFPLASVPQLDEGQEADFTFRAATSADIPHLVAWDHYYAQQFLVTHVITPELWEYELSGRSQGAPFYIYPLIITDKSGRDVGYLAMRASLAGRYVNCLRYVVGPESSYLATFGDALREMKAFADRAFENDPDARPGHVSFDSGLPHAVDRLIERTWPGLVRQPERIYTWYLRVPDLPAFIRHIAPALEKRLENSGANRYTGDLKIGFYDLTGITIQFENGRIASVTHGDLPLDEGDADFPYLTFLNLVFGHRTLDDLAYVLPEVTFNRKAAVLLDALFPTQRSWVVAQT
jgi:GNAT superfamily N-acetyltransferase